MRFVLPVVLCLFPLAVARAQDEARAIVNKAIQKMGLDTLKEKYKASTSKMKGKLHAEGTELEFTGEVATQGPDQQRIALDLDVMGMKVAITQVLNKDKGWVKINDMVMDMDRDKLAQTLEEAYTGWVANLVPLKDAAFNLSNVGEVQVDGKPAQAVRVTREGKRDVTLCFDKETSILVKMESRVKDEGTGQDVTQETFFSNYGDKALKIALKLVVKRDGKPFIEAELSDIKPEEKLDDSTFDKP